VAQLSNTTFDNLMDGVVLRPLNAWHRATFVDGGTEKLIAFSDDPAATIVFTFPSRFHQAKRCFFSIIFTI